MKKLIFFLLASLAFFSCKKNDTPPELPDQPTGKYYFNYTFDGKSNGYSFSTALIDKIPSSEWNYLDATSGGFEISGGEFPNLQRGPGEMSYDEQIGISVIYNGCGVDGKAKCYYASIGIKNLSKGTYTFTNGMDYLAVSEATSTNQMVTLFSFSSQSIQPGETISLTILSVGNKGELVTGEFSGKVKNSSGVLVNVSGKFAVPRTS